MFSSSGTPGVALPRSQMGGWPSAFSLSPFSVLQRLVPWLRCGKGLVNPTEGSCPQRQLWSVVSIDILGHLEDIERGKVSKRLFLGEGDSFQEAFVKLLLYAVLSMGRGEWLI